MFDSIAPNIWVRQELFRFAMLDLPHQMTVIRLEDDSLFLHSPVKPAAAVLQALQPLGQVRYIVAPSWWHDSYLYEYARAFPEARICAPRAVARAHPEVVVSIVLDEDAVPWRGEIEQFEMLGVRLFMNEFEFYHKPSRTLVVADAIHSLPNSAPKFTRLRYRLVRAYPGCNVPRFYRWALKDSKALRASVDRMLQLDLARIIVSHCNVIDEDPKACIRQCYAWLR